MRCSVAVLAAVWSLSGLPDASAKGPPPQCMFRCLRKVRATALTEGADLPVDCGGAEMPRTPCAARCEGRCWLRGDFDGDGAAEVAVAQHEKGEATLWIVRSGTAAVRWQPAAFFPLKDADDVALVNAARTSEIVQANLAVRGERSPLKLADSESFAFGLVTWKHAERAWDGQMMAVIFSKTNATYRMIPILELEASAR